MYKKLRDAGRLNMTLLLAAMSFFCLALSVLRVLLSGSSMYLFLNWNLFLAFIPWVATTAIILNEKYRRNWLILIILLGIWGAFFANSPYILTDLIHLRRVTSIPVWFDLVLILSFAWTGLVFGFVSLLDIEAVLYDLVRTRWVSLVSVALLFASGFGIYMGRFLRWNTWDIVVNPYNITADVFHRVINPFAYSRTWIVTILIGILLNMMFWTIKLITAKRILAERDRF